jgi:hypothetical protein
MSKISAKIAAIVFVCTVALAGLGWAEGEEATEKTPASADAPPPASADEAGEPTEESKDEAAAEE